MRLARPPTVTFSVHSLRRRVRRHRTPWRYSPRWQRCGTRLPTLPEAPQRSSKRSIRTTRQRSSWIRSPGPATARLTPSQLAVGIGATITMSWSAVGASSCTASGGTAGDGWSGTLSASGSQPIKESTTGAITYGISCTYPDGHQSSAQVTVTWLTSSPVASVFAPAESVGGRLMAGNMVYERRTLHGSRSAAPYKH